MTNGQKFTFSQEKEDLIDMVGKCCIVPDTKTQFTLL